MNPPKGGRVKIASPGVLLATVAAAQGCLVSSELTLRNTTGDVVEHARVAWTSDDSQETASTKISLPSQFARDEEEWRAADNRRFELLAEKEALEAITESEQIELDALTRKRRIAQMEDNGEEFLLRIQRQKALSEAIRAVEAYARFIR